MLLPHMWDKYLRLNKKIGFQLLALVFLFQARVARAYDFNENSGLDNTAGGGGYKETALNSAGSIDIMIAKIITRVLSLVGVVFMFLIMWAGIRWMFANGDDEQVKKAKHTL